MILRMNLQNKILSNLQKLNINCDNLIYIYEVLNSSIGKERFINKEDECFYESFNYSAKIEEDNFYYNCILYEKENSNVINILFKKDSDYILINEIYKNDNKIFIHNISKNFCCVKYYKDEKYKECMNIVNHGVERKIINSVKEMTLLLEFLNIKETTLYNFDEKQSYYEVLKRLENSSSSIVIRYLDNDGIVRVLE